MRNRLFFCALTGVLLLLSSCRSHYQMTGVERSRIVVDSRYDRQPDEAAVRYLAPYKHQVDSAMGPVMGRVARNMHAERPESNLSNLLSDVMVWAAKDYNEQVVLGIYNMGGIRADLTRGEVTYGDVLDVAPFENKIAFTTLKGETLLKLFQQIAKRGGEGVSRGCELVISKEGELVSAHLNGQEIDPQGEYRVATIDYLLGGNDGMSAMNEGHDVRSPQDKQSNTRFIIMNYFKEKAAKGEVVDAQVEGRITLR